jgi:hypothetical protein
MKTYRRILTQNSQALEIAQENESLKRFQKQDKIEEVPQDVHR